jgi:NADPH-dependent 2,4-dienoyl-CoA reductase/sulfur reductase-like enzyme/rhodanese-related sulfurtransferase
MKKTVIIGGVAGGATTAARLRRLDESAEIILLERGPHISYANCGLPYYIGGTITRRDALFLQTPKSFSTRFACDVRVGHEAIKLDPVRKILSIRELASGRVYEETFDTCVLSPGAAPIRPNIPGIDDTRIFTLRNVGDTDAIHGYIQEHKPASAVVAGGGYIGLEMAENLKRIGLSVTVVEAADQMLAPLDPEMAAMVHQHLARQDVAFRLSDPVAAFEPGEKTLRVRLKSGTVLEAGLVILSVGVRPDSGLAKEAGLALGTREGIKVDEFLRTSAPGIYAVGDAIEFPHPITGQPSMSYLAGPANKQARIAAENIVTGDTVRYKGTWQTAIARIFDITAASTGLSEKALKSAGIPCVGSITHSSSHAGYYPGGLPISIKLLFAPSNGKILGAQVVGFDGVDKRIDLIASVLRTGGTVQDLVEFEHAYAPPYSSARDPVNIAGLVADDILRKLSALIRWDEIAGLDPAKTFLLDVRTVREFASAAIPGAVNIHVDDLRGRLSEIPRDREIVVYCGVGLRAFVALRILVQNGFPKVRNLSGGITTWLTAVNWASKKISP